MRKFLLLLVIAALGGSSLLFAQEGEPVMIFKKGSGDPLEIPLNTIDSLTFQEISGLPLVALSTNVMVMDSVFSTVGKFEVTATFSEEMDTNITPGLSLGAAEPANAFNLRQTNWGADGLTYTLIYDIKPSVPRTVFDVTISGAKDLNGNTIEKTVLEGVVVDTKKPLVVSASVTADMLTDKNAGQQVIVTVNFNENMNMDVNPILAFEPAAAVATFTNPKYKWTNPKICQITYSVVDDNQEFENVSIEVRAAKDLAGNTMPKDTAKLMNAFIVDMLNPGCTDIVASSVNVTFDMALEELTISVMFNEPMGAKHPDIQFLPNNELVKNFLLKEASSDWDNQTTRIKYVFRFTVQNGGQQNIRDITVKITGAEDLNGNPLENCIKEDYLNILFDLAFILDESFEAYTSDIAPPNNIWELLLNGNNVNNQVVTTEVTAGHGTKSLVTEAELLTEDFAKFQRIFIEPPATSPDKLWFQFDVYPTSQQDSIIISLENDTEPAFSLALGATNAVHYRAGTDPWVAATKNGSPVLYDITGFIRVTVFIDTQANELEINFGNDTGLLDVVSLSDYPSEGFDRLIIENRSGKVYTDYFRLWTIAD